MVAPDPRTNHSLNALFNVPCDGARRGKRGNLIRNVGGVLSPFVAPVTLSKKRFE